MNDGAKLHPKEAHSMNASCKTTGRKKATCPDTSDTMNDRSVILEQLKQTQLFSSMTSSEVASLMDKITIRNFRKNDVILYEDSNNYMYQILSGKVKVVQTGADGKEIIRAIHKTGDSFGELSLIGRNTSSATVVALEDTAAAIISRTNFFAILYAQNKVIDNLISMFCLRLHDSWERVRMINFKNAPNRVAMLLRQLSSEHGEKTPEGILLTVKLTHQNIADMTGLTREAVTRAFDKFQKNGSVAIGKDKSIFLSRSFAGTRSLANQAL
jgi:CRP/FNR family transcriptional regulator